MRLARFNIQTATRRPTSATSSACRARRPAAVIASTVYLLSRRACRIARPRSPALAMVLVPALLMVSTIRFRSVKAIDVGWRRSYFALFLAAVVLALIASHPRLALVVMSYTYVVGALIVLGVRPAAAGRRIDGPSDASSATAGASSPDGSSAPESASASVDADSASGSRTLTVVPAPFALSHLDRAAAQLDVAAGDRQAEAGAGRLGREVGSKTRASASSSMPTPVSRTSSRTAAGVHDRVDRQSGPAPGIACSAFSTMFGERAGDERAIDEHRRQRRRHAVLDLDAALPGRCGRDRRLRATSSGSVDRRRAARSATRRSWRTPTRSAGAAGPARGSSVTQLSSTAPSGSPRSA